MRRRDLFLISFIIAFFIITDLYIISNNLKYINYAIRLKLDEIGIRNYAIFIYEVFLTNARRVRRSQRDPSLRISWMLSVSEGDLLCDE